MASKDVIAQRIKVMQAYVDGKEIQARRRNTARPEGWVDSASPELEFHWDIIEYRIKPHEPRRVFIRTSNEGHIQQRATCFLAREKAEEGGNANCIVEFVEVIPGDSNAN